MKKIIPTNAILIPDHAKWVFKGVIFDVYQWPQKLFDGSTTTFEMLRRVDTVKAICVVEDKIMVLDEDQPLAESRGHEFPGGRVERGASSCLSEIKREVLEETGYSFRNWRLVHVQQSNQHTEGFFHYFLATEPSERVPVKRDAGERIRMELLSFAKVKAETLRSSENLGHIRELFRPLHSLDDLLQIPEFTGQEVDR